VQGWIAKQQAFWGASLKAIDDLLRAEDRKGGR